VYADLKTFINKQGSGFASVSSWVPPSHTTVDGTGSSYDTNLIDLNNDGLADFYYLAHRVFWWKYKQAFFYNSGRPVVRILSLRYSSSRSPKARRWRTRILLFRPSTKPRATLFPGLQYAAMPSQCFPIMAANFS
jgi:hypothetical protein